MLDEEEEVAFRIFTADTGNASRDGWEASRDKDHYRRFARAAMNFLAPRWLLKPH